MTVAQLQPHSWLMWHPRPGLRTASSRLSPLHLPGASHNIHGASESILKLSEAVLSVFFRKAFPQISCTICLAFRRAPEDGQYCLWMAGSSSGLQSFHLGAWDHVSPTDIPPSGTPQHRYPPVNTPAKLSEEGISSDVPLVFSLWRATVPIHSSTVSFWCFFSISC